MGNAKVKPHIYSPETENSNSFESLGKGVVKTLKKDLIQNSGKDFMSQLLGIGSFDSEKSSEKPIQSQELNIWDYITFKSDKEDKGNVIHAEDRFKNNGQSNETPDNIIHAEKRFNPDIAPGFDYKREIIHGESRSTKEATEIIKRQIQEILGELRRLISSSSELQVTYKDVTQEQRIEKPGKYHINFFDWVLTVVRQARMKVEDAGSWLAMFKNKKGQHQYWKQAKNKGTSFTQNNERTVATQTG